MVTNGIKWRIAGLATALTVAMAVPSAAQAAGPLGGGCPESGLSKPFARWLDPMKYTLVPSGAFERGGSAWSLSGAAVRKGNEPWQVAGAGHTRSLRIGAGGSATSRAMCVDVEHPTLRFFVRGPGSPLAVLRVEAIVRGGGLGVLDRIPIGAATGLGGWRPSLPMPILKNLLGLLPGHEVTVAFRFIASGGSFQVDDVYVDPYGKG